MILKKIFLVLIFFYSILSAQNLKLQGSVYDAINGESLKYANIRVLNSTIGTAANFEGDFILKLPAGKYTIVVSYLGYKSKSIETNLDKDKNIIFRLQPTSILLNEITVLPGKNPALEIIKRAITVKHERFHKLNSYESDVYTKGAIKTTKDISSSGKGVGLSLGESDSSKLKITGIIENESISYFKKPNKRKEKIIARKQSANFPSTINIVTGGRILQNFYDDDVQFFGQPLPGPLSDYALGYYYYYITDTLAQDNSNIFKIYFAAISDTDPGFYGDIYIKDKTFDLVRLEVHLNKAANPGGLLTNNTIFQQFAEFSGIYMPIDYRLFADANYLGLVKFGFNLNTIMRNYKINIPINDDLFDKAVVTVLPDADKKNNDYWKATVPALYTKEENEAYRRIDSLEAVPTTFWQRFSPFSNKIVVNDNVSISGPLYIYYFNRVSGHALNCNFYFEDLLEKRLYSKFNFGYGFADKKFSFMSKTNYYLGKYRTTSISLELYNTITDIFGESDDYNLFTSTVLSLFTKFEFRDYFYKKGFTVSYSSEIFPILKVGVGFLNRTDRSAKNNSDFSFFKKDNIYRLNRPIFETKIYAATADFTLDFRDYIEDGYSRRRTWRGSVLPIISGQFYYSNKSTLKSDLNFQMYRSNIYWRIKTYKKAELKINVNGLYSTGTVPYQMMYALNGNIRAGGKSFSFRTLRIGEVFGDRVLAVNIEHNFKDVLFRALKIPFISELQLLCKVFFNVALSDISQKSRDIIPQFLTNSGNDTNISTISIKSFNHPFFELGFGIGQELLPISFEFTWKLNYRGQNNFVIGINTFAF